MYLGLDISSKYVGWCIFDSTKKYIDVGCLDLSKKETLYDKLDVVNDFLDELVHIKHCLIRRVFIEAPLQASNNINVVNLLQRWNGMCSALIYSKMDIAPELMRQTEALKSAEIKIPKGVKGKERKKYILQCVKDFGIIEESKWQFKRTGNPKDHNFDMADSFLVVYAGMQKE